MPVVSTCSWSRHLLPLFTLAVAGAISCSGQVSDGPSKPGGAGGRNGGSGPDDDGAGEPGVDPGTKGAHRLNAAEYNATVADVLGTTLQPADASWLGGQIGVFDNMADVLHVDEDQFKRYMRAAGQIADDVFASNELKSKLLICSGEDGACVKDIIAKMGLRIFRRPLEDDELGTFNKLYGAARTLGEDRDGGIRQVLRALLSSADFLYRLETDPDPASTEKHQLNAYELASRLSYFLWSSAPDEELLAAAADGSLLKEETLIETIDRMLDDPRKSSRLAHNFAGQWLGARELPRHAVDKAVFPDWSPQLAASLSEEVYQYFSEFLASDRSWLDFLKADINFVDANVAKLYGRQGGALDSMKRMEITDDNRFGFAGLGGFLAITSQAKRTSPTKRGHWIMTHLLCTVIPPPPPDAANPESNGFDPTKNVRLTLSEHRENPSCAGCHAAFDPYGLSLEHFDAIGKYRTNYVDGTPVDASADLEDVSFSGLEGLADTVTADPQFSRCLPEFLLNYGLGRPITETDKPYLDAVHDEWMQETPSIRRLLHTLVLSEPFRYRRGAASSSTGSL